MKIACGSLMDCNASCERTGERGKENCGPVFASSVSPQRLTFLPINRALLLRVRQPLMGYPWAGLQCHQSGCCGPPASFCVLGLAGVCVTSFPGRWYFSRCPTPLYREVASLLCLLAPDMGLRHWLLHFPSLAPQVSPSCRLWFLQLPKINK